MTGDAAATMPTRHAGPAYRSGKGRLGPPERRVLWAVAPRAVDPFGSPAGCTSSTPPAPSDDGASARDVTAPAGARATAPPAEAAQPERTRDADELTHRLLLELVRQQVQMEADLEGVKPVNLKATTEPQAVMNLPRRDRAPDGRWLGEVRAAAR
jgi:hypothetical protein